MSEGNVKRENYGSQLMGLANNVSKKAGDLSVNVVERLSGVTTPDVPRLENEVLGKDSKVAETWPPFLHDLRAVLWEIQGNLNNIRNTIDRLEI